MTREEKKLIQKAVDKMVKSQTFKKVLKGIVLKNYTPHPICIYNNDNELIQEIESSGIIRLEEEIVETGSINNIKTVSKSYYLSNLPEPEENTIFIVSFMVLDKIVDRFDFVAPDTGVESVVREPSGKIKGIKNFQTRS